MQCENDIKSLKEALTETKEDQMKKKEELEKMCGEVLQKCFYPENRSW